MKIKHMLQGLLFIAALGYGINAQAQVPNMAYIANACWYCFDTGADEGSISVCPVNSDGTLATCTRFTDSSIYYPFDIAIGNAGATAYIFNSNSNVANNTISICPVNTSTGALETCTSVVTLPITYDFGGVLPDGSFLYFVDSYGNNVYVCPINSDGTLGTCTQMSDPSFNSPNGRIAITPNGDFAYVANFYSTSVSVCPINSDGTFGTCTADSAKDSNGHSTLVNPLAAATDPTGTWLYIPNSDINSNLDISVCTINSTDGSLSDCTTKYDSTLATMNFVNNLYVGANAFAYIPNDVDSTIAVCGVNSDGTLGTCAAASDSTFFYPESVWLTGSVASSR